ncbi:MAG TPA: antibiotic biosynthesis monooxygenase family protein [Thermoanaerobaculia bacterium]|jgi:heme-degrading monooxygenase HmoA
MFATIWRFSVRPECTEDFEEHYGTDGAWATLFRKAPGYVRTDLLRDTATSNDYVTMDVWEDLASYEAFRENHAAEYAKIDRLCERFTTAEEHLGNIETDSPS